MSSFETWIPYVRLYQERGGKKVPVGDTRQSLTETNYGQTSIMGLKSVRIKYGAGFITCDVTMPIHQSIIQGASIPGESEMSKMFTLTNYWDIEFGWAHSSYGGYKLSRMKISDWALDYDQATRMFNVTVTLIPAHTLVLQDIKVFMLTTEISELTRLINEFANRKKSAQDSSGSAGGHPLSTGNVVTKILDGCRRIIRDSKFEEFNPVVSEDTPPPRTTVVNDQKSLIGQFPDPYKRKVDANGNLMFPSVSRNPDGSMQFNDDATLVNYPSEILKNASVSDIPDPDFIRMNLLGPSTEDVTALAKAFHDEAMDSDNTLSRITDRKNKDMNCLQFICDLLRDNGFMWQPTFSSVNAEGSVQWMIIQSDFNNFGEHHELEFVGIRNYPLVAGDKFINTFGGRASASGEKPQLFDLHSNRSMVISVNAATDQGRSTLGTATAADAMSTQETTYPAGKTITANKNQMWAFLAQESKELNLECLGLPEIKIGDNICVNLAGDLYSGKYKIIEMSHKFDGDFTTDIRAIRIKSGSANGPEDQDAQVAVLPTPEQLPIGNAAIQKIENATPEEKKSMRQNGVVWGANATVEKF